jgi:O-antigen/teichoic acid export membrane protein
VSDNLRRVLHARHHQRRDLKLVMAATAGGLAATAVLAPWLGAMGAAYATLVGELLLIILVIRALAVSGPAPPLATALAFPALAAAAMAAVVLLVQSYGLVASIAAGGLVYLGAVWLARARLLDDLRQFELRPPGAG